MLMLLRVIVVVKMTKNDLQKKLFKKMFDDISEGL